jgi:hypothetical protein
MREVLQVILTGMRTFCLAGGYTTLRLKVQSPGRIDNTHSIARSAIVVLLLQFHSNCPPGRFGRHQNRDSTGVQRQIEANL